MSEQDTDLTIPELVERMNELIAASFIVFLKFTCEKCGNKLAMSKPNSIFKTGSCDKCGHITEIKKGGILAIKAFDMKYSDAFTFIEEIAKAA